MKVERYVSDEAGAPAGDDKFIRELIANQKQKSSSFTGLLFWLLCQGDGSDDTLTGSHCCLQQVEVVFPDFKEAVFLHSAEFFRQGRALDV